MNDTLLKTGFNIMITGTILITANLFFVKNSNIYYDIPNKLVSGGYILMGLSLMYKLNMEDIPPFFYLRLDIPKFGTR